MVDVLRLAFALFQLVRPVIDGGGGVGTTLVGVLLMLGHVQILLRNLIRQMYQGQVAFVHQSRLVVTLVYAGVASRSVRSLPCTS